MSNDDVKEKEAEREKEACWDVNLPERCDDYFE
jgi:hypothetical protein